MAVNAVASAERDRQNAMEQRHATKLSKVDNRMVEGQVALNTLSNPFTLSGVSEPIEYPGVREMRHAMREYYYILLSVRNIQLLIRLFGTLFFALAMPAFVPERLEPSTFACRYRTWVPLSNHLRRVTLESATLIPWPARPDQTRPDQPCIPDG
ncbi:hypothetical protein LY76DRAFT_637791 [Colletotrichum caudatum]|nr:hypothetical protein LY76DRAFT_637791 [Colletotrichum caudatum]